MNLAVWRSQRGRRSARVWETSRDANRPTIHGKYWTSTVPVANGEHSGASRRPGGHHEQIVTQTVSSPRGCNPVRDGRCKPVRLFHMDEMAAPGGNQELGVRFCFDVAVDLIQSKHGIMVTPNQ